jgi:hypothetical protein
MKTRKWEISVLGTVKDCILGVFHIFRGFKWADIKEAFGISIQQLHGKFQDARAVDALIKGYQAGRKEHYRSTLISIIMMDVITLTSKFPILPWIAGFIVMNGVSTFLFEYRHYQARKADVIYSVMES